MKLPLFVSMSLFVLITFLISVLVLQYNIAGYGPKHLDFVIFGGPGVSLLIIGVIPGSLKFKNIISRCFQFLSQLLKSIWVFFPGILFLILPIFCFWLLGQGKDTIVAFIDNRPFSNKNFSFNYFRPIFFIAIGFWVYVSWYSSRIISYIKKRQQLELQEQTGMDANKALDNFDQGKDYFEIGKFFLEEIPRLIGHSCFLILELAVLQSPVLTHPISSLEAGIFFFIFLIILSQVNQWINRGQFAEISVEGKKTFVERASFKKSFWILLIIFIVMILFTSFFDLRRFSIWPLFVLLLLFHTVFIFYINFRREEIEKSAHTEGTMQKIEARERRSLLKKTMDYFYIPLVEIGYYRWFLRICAGGITFYCMAIFWLAFARGLGPFSFIILAFGVLLAFGNIVTAFSIRYKLNFHFFLFLLAFLLGLGETHEVRTIPVKDNGYEVRPNLKTYLTKWLDDKNIHSDTCYDMYFVMSNGGASRSGYWTAAVLGKIEDSTLVNFRGDRFSDHVFCLSGTSGGGVGVATFFSLLLNKEQQTKPLYTASAQGFLRQDYFTFTLARMLGPDFFNYIFHFSATQDRAAALESSFESSAHIKLDSVYPVPFAEPFSTFSAMKGGSVQLPILFVNTTRMQDGNPGVVTNLDINFKNTLFNKRTDVVKLLDKNRDISITSGAILGARFPYLSPAGRIANDYFVDGGYFDNSGSGVVLEMIRGILRIAKEDTTSKIREQIRRINFKVLHIVNSPAGSESAGMKSIAPIKNDLVSPILTIVGAYEKQTSVNDLRLTNYINDINLHEENRASYTQISLYKNPDEWQQDPLYKSYDSEPPYPMNWFMSDTIVNRINIRLAQNSLLDSVIKNFGRKSLIK